MSYFYILVPVCLYDLDLLITFNIFSILSRSNQFRMSVIETEITRIALT